MNLKSDSIVVFTDGSSRGNPGPGGFGAVIVYNDRELKVSAKGGSALGGESEKLKVTELGGRGEHTTNNRMELQAAIEALQSITNNQTPITKITVYTDSSYLVNGITKWVYSWERRNWVTMDKKPVLNKDLWEKLLELSKGKSIEWKTVGGHVGVAGNVRCDEIATAFADNLPPKLYADVLKNYSMPNILDIKEDAGAAKEKSASRAHSNAKAFSYVSKVDGKIETHKTWAECEARVKGKPARFKKATSKEEEARIIATFGKEK